MYITIEALKHAIYTLTHNPTQTFNHMYSNTNYRKIKIENIQQKRTKTKKDTIMIIWKYKNIQIWKYTNINKEKYKCEKCKIVCKEIK